MGGGAGGCYLRSQNVYGLWLDVEEESTVYNDWIGCNFKPFGGHTFIKTTKNDQFCDSLLPPSAKINQTRL